MAFIIKMGCENNNTSIHRATHVVPSKKVYLHFFSIRKPRTFSSKPINLLKTFRMFGSWSSWSLLASVANIYDFFLNIKLKHKKCKKRRFFSLFVYLSFCNSPHLNKMPKLNEYYTAIFDALMHAEMAIAFCLKGVDLVRNCFWSVSENKNVYLWFWYDFPNIYCLHLVHPSSLFSWCFVEW